VPGRAWRWTALGILVAALLGVAVSRATLPSAGQVAATAAGVTPPGDRGASPGGGTGASDDGGARAGSGSGGTDGDGGRATVSGGDRITVHVTGEVRRPGVYRLPDGSRVVDAIRRAGRARGGDAQALNLAAPLRDGQQVRVPPRASPGSGAGASGPGGGGGDASSAAGASTGGGGPIDLNTASVEELQTLDGVGPATAEKIVRLREERGGLSGVDDLAEVPGIGEKKLEALRAQLEP